MASRVSLLPMWAAFVHRKCLGAHNISDRKAFGMQRSGEQCQQEWRWLLDDESTFQESAKDECEGGQQCT